MSRYEFVTFDCYGTLVDWERGIGDAFVEAARRDGSELDPAAVVAAFMKIEPIVEAGAYRSYREILDDCARQVARRLAWRLPEHAEEFLARSLGGWPPFPDTRPALERLRAAGCGLGILSNVDGDLLDATLERLGVEFELVVTAEQVRSYKPARAHFTRAAERLRGRSWLHAAQSHFHDVVPAKELGIPVAWINRRHESPREDVRPDHEFGSLAELCDWLV